MIDVRHDTFESGRGTGLFYHGTTGEGSNAEGVLVQGDEICEMYGINIRGMSAEQFQQAVSADVIKSQDPVRIVVKRRI